MDRSFANALDNYRLHNKISIETLTARLGISLGTLKNRERGRIYPNRKSWHVIRMVLGHKGGSATRQKGRSLVEMLADY
jgi:DNA-binding transcriptional regulator YiaG